MRRPGQHAHPLSVRHSCDYWDQLWASAIWIRIQLHSSLRVISGSLLPSAWWPRGLLPRAPIPCCWGAVTSGPAGLLSGTYPRPQTAAWANARPPPDCARWMVEVGPEPRPLHPGAGPLGRDVGLRAGLAGAPWVCCTWARLCAPRVPVAAESALQTPARKSPSQRFAGSSTSLTVGPGDPGTRLQNGTWCGCPGCAGRKGPTHAVSRATWAGCRWEARPGHAGRCPAALYSEFEPGARSPESGMPGS